MALRMRRTFGFGKTQSIYNRCQSRWTELTDKIKNFETPERFKDTFVERWGKYWKNLYLDYQEVAVDVVKGCKERPVRASIYSTILGGSYYLAKHNPDEISYKHKYLVDTTKLVTVGEKVRNPLAVNYIKFLDKCYNENIVRHLNLGVISFIWIDNFDSVTSHYKATCKYTKPQYVTFHQRIIDVGFLDTWWMGEKKMKEYDVNDEEFKHITNNVT